MELEILCNDAKQEFQDRKRRRMSGDIAEEQVFSSSLPSSSSSSSSTTLPSSSSSTSSSLSSSDKTVTAAPSNIINEVPTTSVSISSTSNSVVTDHIKLNIKYLDSVICINVARNALMSKVFKGIARHLKMDSSSSTFYYGGVKLFAENNPKSMDLREDDAIDCFPTS